MADSDSDSDSGFNWSEVGQNVVSAASDTRGHFVDKHMFHYPENGHTTVEILKKNRGGHGGESICRFNNPHGAVDYSHVSFNPPNAGGANPHARIPRGAPRAARTGAKAAQKLSKAAQIAGPAVDAGNLVYSGYQDYQHGTTRNTVETLSGIGGGFAGGEAGAMLGATIGSAGGPFGAFVVAILLAVAGGIAGSYAAESTADAIGDRVGYNTEIRICKKCGKKTKVRIYRGENYKCCRRRGKEC